METEYLGAVEFERCPNCRGIFLDIGELQMLVRHPDFRMLENAETPHSDEEDKKEASCPRCNVKMESYRRIMGELRLDMCPTCNGLWLDQGELVRLQDSDDANTFDRLATRLRGLGDTIRRRKPE